MKSGFGRETQRQHRWLDDMRKWTRGLRDRTREAEAKREPTGRVVYLGNNGLEDLIGRKVMKDREWELDSDEEVPENGRNPEQEFRMRDGGRREVEQAVDLH